MKKLLTKIRDGVRLYIKDPYGFWGIDKTTPTLEEQIASGQARTDEELDQVVRCPFCNHIIS